MNILVTGGAGYIGSITTELLCNEGHTVTVLDSLAYGHRKAVHPAATLVTGYVGDYQLTCSLIRKNAISAILHFAADSQVGESMQNPAKYFSNNVGQGLELIRAASDCSIDTFILSSTAATYGEPTQIPISETHPTNPTNPYGETKRILEKALHWHHTCRGLKYVSLRYFNASGASERFGEDHTPETHLIPLVLDVAAGTRPDICVFGDDYPTPDGTCIRDYIHVSDLARAHILALKTTQSSIYNLGNGNGFSVKQVIDTAAEVTGKPIAHRIVPRRDGDPAQLVASADKIRRELGWKPHYASLAQTIETAWRWKLQNPHGYGDK
ncbi:UDP-glucose 4-epimerase GalE [bacterium]|nr:UDP-glucose 4-epimerase GalE [bacterium]